LSSVLERTTRPHRRAYLETIAANMSNPTMPTTGEHTTLVTSMQTFLKDRPTLDSGGDVDFHLERRHHTEMLGLHNLSEDKQVPIEKVEFTAVRVPHNTIPRRLF